MPAYTSTQASSPCSTAQTSTYSTAGAGGAAPPAPAVEYVLVCAVEQGDEAWVEVYAGIDINPAALTLPAVPLDS